MGVVKEREKKIFLTLYISPIRGDRGTKFVSQMGNYGTRT